MLRVSVVVQELNRPSSADRADAVQVQSVCLMLVHYILAREIVRTAAQVEEALQNFAGTEPSRVVFLARSALT